MIITTTNNIDNLQIDQYIDIVFCNVVLGNNFISEFLASFTDTLGGFSGTYQGKLEEAYNQVRAELTAKAQKMGANAIVGVRYDFEEITGKNMSMFMATATGTAVKVSRSRVILYEKLHALKTYLDDGILSEEEYEYEKNRLEGEFSSPISEEIRVLEEFEARKKEQIEREKKAEQDRIEREAAAAVQRKEIASQIANNKDLIFSVTVSDVLKADSSVIEEGGSLGDIAKKAMCKGKIAEFCRYYTETTGLDASDAIEYIHSLYELMQK